MVTRLLAFLDDVAGGLGLGVIAAIITLVCFHPVGTAMIIRWVLS